MNRICVYAGARSGVLPAYEQTAAELGRELVRRGLELVYGAGSTGLMGAVADGVLESGGTAIGVVPKGLFPPEVIHTRLKRIIEVENMHQRKATMHELADAFIALPGGFGTWEELTEALCWSQLRIHRKPVGLLNVEGYWNPLLAMTEHAVKTGFVSADHADLLICEEDPAKLLDRIMEAARREEE
ncbi:TIGR00730 family Rossman fold protein [Staphylospora marina]|uniref:LOG family protein n=1 Tax=Staphylospora marina TaxID=2490858 RepID=UPI000F5C1D8C|nr:TIGR00730 family Rossman fold protein [Staphylospora marina]